MGQKIAYALILCGGLCLSVAAVAAEPTESQPSASKPKAHASTVAAKVHAKTVAQKRVSAPAPMLASEVAPEEVRTEVSNQVLTGRMVCELGNFVQVSVDEHVPGGFVVQLKQHTYHMLPVVSSTGAIRLEDAHAGAMWLQLANKSMLMNSKIGQRMADECQSPQQMAVAEAMKLAPPPSLLDGPHVAKK